MAALEAMACKVPSIATRVGGVPELIDDGVTGLLYEVGDIEGMSLGALSLLKDREKLDAMRECGPQNGAETLLLIAGGAALCAVLRVSAQLLSDQLSVFRGEGVRKSALPID